MNKNEKIAAFKKSRISNKDHEILQLCKLKKVLDVGCVGQQRSYSDPTWLHNQIKSVASETIGVDIDHDGIKKLNDHGYFIRHIDEMKKGEVFDTIVMGDVIEHVDNVVSFLDFYRGFLSTNGVMVITTPNPFSFRQVLHTFFYSKPSINPEHTCHLDPITMLEIIRRSDFSIEDFCWLREYKRGKGLKNLIIHFLANVFVRFRKFYSQNFMIVLSNKPG